MATPTSEVTVLIPTLLRPLIGDRATVPVPTPSAVPLAQLLDDLHQGYPVFARRIRDETGALRRYVNVYVDGEDVRRLEGLSTPVPPGAEVMIVQSVAGG
ncbi:MULTISPECIES: MoaD/ThiS family protein [unclassified Arthrobacter]|uniref:MoaD/ThiS family protein n=1 Tax=unclassified Arthrobacter TaxID=235627 RepID=UPI001490E7D3|nr:MULTISPECIES: MoaD/ThiS family protein [unclassified Arthrobacter]MBE0008557.1 MoaD/ThiS family protein [Arthrobacter sp. AET 35A]NOJ59211.1 molybdopterin synthase sulfur carrier subunit [Arthrobacter sp. 260]NOJ62297.1 molybdopterin synthase sulfur carrier subunit [Arthrobacter sp. 147(2020)]